MNSVNLKKRLSMPTPPKRGYEGRERIYPSEFDSAEPFDLEPFNPGLTAEELVAGCGSVFCGSLVLK